MVNKNQYLWEQRSVASILLWIMCTAICTIVAASSHAYLSVILITWYLALPWNQDNVFYNEILKLNPVNNLLIKNVTIQLWSFIFCINIDFCQHFSQPWVWPVMLFIHELMNRDMLHADLLSPVFSRATTNCPSAMLSISWASSLLNTCRWKWSIWQVPTHGISLLQTTYPQCWGRKLLALTRPAPQGTGTHCAPPLSRGRGTWIRINILS